jgi:hypothetical protein
MMNKVSGKLVVTINDDGTVKTDATKMEADSDLDLEATLNALAQELGGSLKVEKHLPGQHGHTHSHGRHTHRH